MENSINSPDSEPTVPGLKSIFKKPASNAIHAFEVSLNESTMVGINSNQPDTESDGNVTTNKILPFKKPKKTTQESFNISSDESIVNSDLEKSATFVKPKSLFNANKQPFKDPFQVSYNETNTTVTNTSVTNQDVGDDSIESDEDDESLFNKSNPFKRKTKAHNQTSGKLGNAIEVSFAGANESVQNNSPVNVEETGKNTTFGNSSVSGLDSTTFMTKPNPFKRAKKSKNDSSIMKMSVTVQNDSRISSGNRTSDGLEKLRTLSDDVSGTEMLNTSTPPVHKSKLFKKKKSLVSEQNLMQVSPGEETNTESPTETCALIDEPKRSLGNLSFDKDISKLTNKSNNSGLYLDQSSINDENLNQWMSDQSDEDMPPPAIPAIPPQLSLTKEKQIEVVASPPSEMNALPSWEEKFQEIVSKSKKTFQMQNIKNKSKISDVEKPNKKPLPVKPLEESNKYKPPKLLKPASFATKRLYQHVINKLKPKYGIDAVIEAEQLICSIADAVRKVTRRKTHQKKLIQDLKKQMATAGLIETTADFYEFIIKFLPYNCRVKIVPCVQPVTNVVHPPKDTVNPFDKIL